MPGEPSLEERDVNGLTLSAWSIELGDDGYTVAEFDLPRDAEFDLAGSVERTVDGMLRSVEGQTGAEGTASVTSLEQTSIGDADAREWTARLVSADLSAQVRGVTFRIEDTVVQVIAIDSDGDDPQASQRFIESVMATGP